MKNVAAQLLEIIKSNFTEKHQNWLEGKIEWIVNNKSTKDLYLTYSMLASKVQQTEPLELKEQASTVNNYLKAKEVNILEVTRIYLLVTVLEKNSSFFMPKVANIIQVADKGELETFLKFLILLPNAVNYKSVAVEALRTNIVSVFDAIAENNPYPGLYFKDEEWNQMYLKAAFMERDLDKIADVTVRANKDLVRIIADYAQERWAASREVDPYLWRPVTKFLDKNRLKDMRRLFNNENPLVKKAAALCCFYSDTIAAKKLLKNYPELLKLIENKELSWETLKR